jgi:glycerol transport system substrate-binding protein
LRTWVWPAKNAKDKDQSRQNKLANEKPKGETIAYQTLLDAWKAGKVR